ncbi:MAG: phospholipid-binding protein MlaC [Thiohalomonadales bacterium]
MKRFSLLLITVMILPLSSTLLANDAAQKLVENTTTTIQAGLAAEQAAIKKDPKIAVALVEKVVLPQFNFTKMSKKALGKNWKKMNDSQKTLFIKEFKTLLVRTYSATLVDNYDQKIKYLPWKSKKGGKIVLVRTELVQPGGFPIPLNYKLSKLKDGSWKVIDVIIDGISLVKNYKKSFAKEIRATSIDKFIVRLQESNQ